MRIGIAGAGPAGLLFARLARSTRPDAEIVIVEQNARDATFGFGVVFSHGALEFLARDVPAVHATLARATETWPIQRVVHRDTVVDIDGNGFCAIERLALLGLLRDECERAGVEIRYGTAAEIADFARCDLVVAADGVHSALRREHADVFRPRIEWLTNKFVWYGTTRRFDCLTLTFRENAHGAFVAHHYRYAPDRSTFIVECDAATWHRAGLNALDDAASRAYCEALFAPDLDGRPLISNRSQWRNFPLLTNQRWSAGNVVLIGDALRTGHFSIGSGTRLAFDDAIALARALGDAKGVGAIVAGFERERRPVVDKLVAAANASSYWYERMADKMAQTPLELAYDYMTRSGRMSDARLGEAAPAFMAAVRAERARHPDAPARGDPRLADPVADDTPGAREIGFAVPARYNAAALLYDNLSERRDKIAIVCGERRVTYGEICALADRAGNGFRAMGLAREGRVLMLQDDGPEYVAAIFGALRAGFVPVLVNTLSPPEQVAYFLQDSGAEAAVVDARFAALLGHPDTATTRLRRVVCVGGATAALPAQVLRHDWDAWIGAQPAELEPADTHRDAMAFWMYSSGSTGRPKGVIHLQHDPLYTHLAYGRGVLGLTADDIVFSPPKIFFAYGFGNSLTFPFAAGATTVLMPGRPDADAVFATLERCRPTVLFGLPTLYVALAAHPGSATRDLSSLRLCVSAAETLAPELFAAWQQRYGLPIVEGLGSTEVLHIYLSNTPSWQKPGASGCRVPGYELRLTDPDGREVGAGESGVLWVRGHSQAPRYWNRPDKTAETMRNGWIYTGDRFLRDADGFHFFEGRADDLVKVSGQWVHPVEVERCLARHPGVRECAVLAIADANRLMTLAAYVVLAPEHAGSDTTTATLQRFVKEQLLPYKYPRIVRYVDALPKTGTGKIDRQALMRSAG